MKSKGQYITTRNHLGQGWQTYDIYGTRAQWHATQLCLQKSCNLILELLFFTIGAWCTIYFKLEHGAQYMLNKFRPNTLQHNFVPGRLAWHSASTLFLKFKLLACDLKTHPWLRLSRIQLKKLLLNAHICCNYKS